MNKSLMTLSITVLLGSLSMQASAAALSSIDTTVARAERPDKPEKPQKPEKIGALDLPFQIAREASEGPRGRDNERPGDRQRRGGRG
jgi:hypothetical protein